MKAIPLPLPVQRHEEQLPDLQAFQQCLAILATGQCVGQLAAQLAGHAQRQQHILQLGRQLLEYRTQQVVAHRRLVPCGQGLQTAALRLMAQPQAGQLHADHPALGLCIQRLHAGFIQSQAAIVQIIAGLARVQT
ncbi:hypothetical protein D3C77_525820 [compost metagenome]